MCTEEELIETSTTYHSGNSLLFVIPKEIVKRFGKKQIACTQPKMKDGTFPQITNMVWKRKNREFIVEMGEKFLRNIIVKIDANDRIILEPTRLKSEANGE